MAKIVTMEKNTIENNAARTGTSLTQSCVTCHVGLMLDVKPAGTLLC